MTAHFSENANAVGKPAAPAAVPRSQTFRTVAAATIGNAFEYYDFFLYATAAAMVFNTLFFPAADPIVGTIGAFAGYAVGFIARPLGGLVFGHIGDRYGRKVALTWTLALMGVATFLIGLLPTYEQAGMLAPALLVLLRVLQGFAAGGEWGGAILMSTESAPHDKRGFFGAWSQVGVGIGFILSSGAFLLVRQLSPGDFMTWGWRLPFLVSVFVVVAGVVIRSRVPESAEFTGAREHAHHPLREVLRDYKGTLLAAGGIRIAEMTASLMTTTFALAYGPLIGADANLLLIALIISMAADTVGMLIFGHLSDRYGRTSVYAFGIVATAAFILPFFLALGSGSNTLIISAFIIANGICHAAMVGTQPALMTELFPVNIRSSGLALVQSVSGIVVGFVPMTATIMFYQTKSIAPVVTMMICLCTFSLGCLIFTRRAARGVAERAKRLALQEQSCKARTT